MLLTPSLNAAGQASAWLGAVLELQALTPDELDGTTPIVRRVIPQPGEDGLLAARDGRVQRVSDPAALAAALNAREVAIRIDFDHQSERDGPNFRGSTAAEGWLSDFHVDAGGGIAATLGLSSWAMRMIDQRQYRYLSPGLWLQKETREVIDMSSLALVNDPNLLLALNDGTGGGDATDLAGRERRAADREAAAERLMMNAAERAVDDAVRGQRLAPAQKQFVLDAIRAHSGGIEAGIAAFEAAYPADGGSRPALGSLDRRTGPAGPGPGRTTAPAAAFRPPTGRRVDEDALELHSHVAEHARERGISYREAVMELGALTPAA